MDQGDAPQARVVLAPNATYNPQPRDVARKRYNALLDQELLDFAKFFADYLKQYGLPPSLREAAAAAGLLSEGGARKRAWSAVDAGYLAPVARGNIHRFIPTRKTLELMG